jgi:deoxyribodipyrimidine photo-lyase
MSAKLHADEPIVVFWFRRDLRLEDNRGLAEALNSGLPVLPVFIFDSHITEDLPQDDARISFIYSQLNKIHSQLTKRGSSMHIYMGKPLEIWKELLASFQIHAVYANKDYEPYAIRRDQELTSFLAAQGISFHTFKDQVIFEEDEIMKKDGTPYTVFTPYKRRWLERFQEGDLLKWAQNTIGGGFLHASRNLSSIEALGFRPSSLQVPPYDLSGVNQYPALRDFPAADATTHLSPHLRFGTVSIRELVLQLKASDEVFLSELIWREFFMQILFHFPKVVHQNFNPKYNGISWKNDEKDFRRWCEGNTGYPMVDAGMRQLNTSGSMHNRVRMITASFLCKHLLIDWRKGEAYFAEKLLDYELSSNNGNWQWAAGTGCDAAPYFRVFNPLAQMKKFDRNGEYVQRWIPELKTPEYPDPMIDHIFARKRALETYKKGIENYLPEL